MTTADAITRELNKRLRTNKQKGPMANAVYTREKDALKRAANRAARRRDAQLQREAEAKMAEYVAKTDEGREEVAGKRRAAETFRETVKQTSERCWSARGAGESVSAQRPEGD